MCLRHWLRFHLAIAGSLLDLTGRSSLTHGRPVLREAHACSRCQARGFGRP